MDKKIMIIAGESSGDLHGSYLIKNLKKINPDIKISGLGGPLMKKEGADIFYDLTEIAVIGFFEILKNYPKFKYAYNLFLKKLDKNKPNAVILIDYPGFNLKIAKQIKKREIPIIYYISPQVWAWGSKRIKLLKKFVDKMVVVFKFEEKMYQEKKIDAFFSGHPLVDIVQVTERKEITENKYNLDLLKKTVFCLPGSRENEVRKHLPIMLESCRLIKKGFNNVQFLIGRSSNVKESVYKNLLSKENIDAKLVTNDNYNVLNISDFAIICSGTATLEAAILKTPMAIIYKISFLSWLFIKNLIKIPHIGLVNIVAGKKIIPEFVQYEAQPKNIADYIIECLKNKEKTNRIKEELSKVKESLGPEGASKRTAVYIADFLNTS
jgi:lipid-A-disaccharide synthase